MVWFNGDVGEAVKLVKSTSKLLVVQIRSEEDKSLDSVWSNESLKELCEKECICLNLDIKSESGKNFSQIYPVLFLPSVYIIGKDGKPAHVIPTTISAEDLISKINDSLKAPKKEGDANVTTSSVPSTSSIPSTSNDNLAKETTDQETQEAANVSKPSKAELTEKYRKMIEDARMKKQQLKAEEEKRKEIERRELGKNMQNLREKQQQQLMMESIQERKKDKELEKKARDRVKQQIAQDRLEMKKKFDKTKAAEAALLMAKVEKAQSLKEKVEKEKLDPYQNIRLQIRLSNGSRFMLEFKGDDQLRKVVDAVRSENARDIPAQIKLINLYPRKEYLPTDFDRTLRDLQIATGTSLFAVEDTTAGPVSSGTIFNWFFQIIGTFFSFLFGLFSGSTQKTSNQSKTDNQPETSNQARTSSNLNAKEGNSSSKLVRRKRAGNNIHRMHDISSDEEDATWNGNSTQQM